MASEVDTPASLSVPDLWVLSIARSGNVPDIPTVYKAMGVNPRRAVVISDTPLRLGGVAHNRVVVGADRDAQLWNAGLSYIRQREGGDLWDVLLVDPAAPLSIPHANYLREHMRVLDTWMAEPDVFGTIGSRPYHVVHDVRPTDVHPQAVVVCGEMGLLFDTRYYDPYDSWAEYCRRTRACGGSVLVSQP